jgi:hypothetical protein
LDGFHDLIWFGIQIRDFWFVFSLDQRRKEIGYDVGECFFRLFVALNGSKITAEASKHQLFSLPIHTFHGQQNTGSG